MGYQLSGFDGKVAVITGAGRMRSIGRPIALALARAGCDLVLTGSGKPASAYPEDEQRAGWRDIESVGDEVRALGRRVLTLVSEAEWRFPDRPTIQLHLPYYFIADEMVYLTQLAACAHYRPDPLPGTIFGGRFPISIWPRPLMWAFEWHEPAKDLILKRGDPLFYVQFEGMDPSRAVQVVEAERTAEVQAYLEKITGVVNYVNQTFGLFKAAEALRPKKLLVAKARE